MNQKFENFVSALDTARDNTAVRVTFTKQDGTTRDMLCTWGDKGDLTPTYARVFDVQKDGYRTVRADAIIRSRTVRVNG